MAGGVPGHVDHVEVHAERLHMVAALQRVEGLGDALARRAEHRRAGGGAQLGHTARVIGVVVRD